VATRGVTVAPSAQGTSDVYATPWTSQQDLDRDTYTSTPPEPLGEDAPPGRRPFTDKAAGAR
jgi:hypothetical protein